MRRLLTLLPSILPVAGAEVVDSSAIDLSVGGAEVVESFAVDLLVAGGGCTFGDSPVVTALVVDAEVVECNC